MIERPAFPAFLAAAAVAAAALAGCATAVPDSQLGLRKAGVFEVVAPVPFGFDKPGEPIVPLAGSGMPPMIAHAIDDDSRIDLRGNDCGVCHDKPLNIGKPVAAGKPRPAPASHYAVAAAGATPTLKGTVYVCTACHAPQADVPVLVRNNGAR